MTLPSRADLFPPAVEALVRLGGLEVSLQFKRRPPLGPAAVFYYVVLRSIPRPVPEKLTVKEAERPLGILSLEESLDLLARHAPTACSELRKEVRKAQVPERFSVRVEVL